MTYQIEQSYTCFKSLPKKAEKTEKKEKARLDKNREKTLEYAQIIDIRRLVLTNRQVEIGKF